MITKKRLKKIIISIVVFILTLTLFTNRVDASMIDISQSYISQIIGQYYWDNARTKSDNTRTLEDFVNEASNNISSFAQSQPNGFNSLIEGYESTYSSTQGTETEKNNAALISVIERITPYNNNASAIVSHSQSKIATDSGEPETDSSNSSTTTTNSGSSGGGIIDGIVGFLGGGATIVDGIAGVLIYIPRLILMLVGWLLLRIIGLAINGADGLVHGIPLDQILFNRIELLKVNFFSSVDPNAANADLIEAIRTNVAVWYVAIRNVAAVALAVIVLYVGIRMAISSVAEEKARYKRMLTDWVVSLVLLFVLHYIMILIININDGIVSILAVANQTESGAPQSIMDELVAESFKVVSFTSQIAYVAIYFMLAIMIFIFFATYVKRMITIAFLIMIAPIITITYSLDRMGDGKSQALNTWFKNFVYNILLQPFQCIIYLALVKTAVDSIDSANLSSAIIAIIMVFFMYEAEDIIKEIFHFEGKSVANTIAQAALVTSAIGLVSKAASGAKSVRGYAGRTPSQNNNNTTTPAQTGVQTRDQQQSGQPGPGTQPQPSPQGQSPQGQGGQNMPSGSTGTAESGSAWGATKGVGKRLRNAAIKGAIKIPVGVAFGAMGLATGNLAAGMSGFQTGSGLAGNAIANHMEKANLHNFAKDYNNLSSIYTSRGYDNNQIRERTKDLLNGDVEARDWEKEYYNTILKEMDRYIDQGLSADDAITQVEQNVAGVQGGYLGEATMGQRFKGKISDAVKNRRRHNYGSPNGNQNGNNQTN